jgi:phage head maturation protease
MTMTDAQLDEGYRDDVAYANVHDLDEQHHQVAVDFPHEVLDGHRTSWGTGCFDESFAKKLPIMLWQHIPSEPIGKGVRAEGLGRVSRVVGQFSDFDAVPRARQAFAQLRDGDLPGWSFHYRNARSVPHPNVRSARRFTKAEMLEFSPVSFPSIPGTTTSGLRSAGRAMSLETVIGKLDRGLARAAARQCRRDGTLPTEILEHCIAAGYRADIRRGDLQDQLRHSLDRAGLL